MPPPTRPAAPERVVHPATAAMRQLTILVTAGNDIATCAERPIRETETTRSSALRQPRTRDYADSLASSLPTCWVSRHPRQNEAIRCRRHRIRWEWTGQTPTSRLPEPQIGRSVNGATRRTIPYCQCLRTTRSSGEPKIIYGLRKNDSGVMAATVRGGRPARLKGRYILHCDERYSRRPTASYGPTATGPKRLGLSYRKMRRSKAAFPR